MSRKKKLIVFVLCFAIMASMGMLLACAAYGSVTTVYVTSSNTWQSTNMYGNKTTGGSTWHLDVSNKTMWSSPTARLVNSNDAVRSNSLTISANNGVFTGSLLSSATVGYNYYLSVKPASSQIGNDSITGKVNPD